MSFDLSAIRALTFDVFGTVVDWRGSICAEGERLNQQWHTQIDWAQFADAWRAGYQPAMEPIRRGERGWTTIDTLHREILETLLPQYGLTELSEAEKDQLNRVWHRLQPWPDAVVGLQRLKQRYIIATLSNGNVALLVNMAKHAGLPWDCILSAELARQYKPEPVAYQTAATLLGLAPEQVLMVAAHVSDLEAARRVGLRTAYVPRPLEFGAAHSQATTKPESTFDIVAEDFLALSEQLGC